MIGAVVCVIAVLGFVSAIDNGKGLTPPSTLYKLFEVYVFCVHTAAVR
jgi:nitrogen fixation/metabolism regulation signal transduction histidine kinase